ncbi:MAG: DUF4268 domain-containing protein [Crocinitomicaceae bacterium]|nr:DUF4268 domain-containing protein [Crocinitomicaceae bacterium]
MLSKEAQKEFNQDFWNTFRKRMRIHKSSNGRGINWLNYPSDVKSIFIRLEVDKKIVAVNFDVQFKDFEIIDIVWEQLHEMKKVMESTMEVEAVWNPDCYLPNGQRFYRIQWSTDKLNYYNTESHEEIYAFLEARLLKFDEFYQEFKEIVINLVN